MYSKMSFLSVALLILSLISCSPSYNLPEYEKVELLKIDSLVILEVKPKYTLATSCLFFPSPDFIDVKSFETIYPDNLTSKDSIIGGYIAITQLITYPELSKQSMIEGNVMADILIDESGNTVDVKILKSIGGGCEEVVTKALLDTKFNPAKRNKRSVVSISRIVISFKLDEKLKKRFEYKKPDKIKSRKL